MEYLTRRRLGRGYCSDCVWSGLYHDIFIPAGTGVIRVLKVLVWCAIFFLIIFKIVNIEKKIEIMF